MARLFIDGFELGNLSAWTEGNMQVSSSPPALKGISVIIIT